MTLFILYMVVFLYIYCISKGTSLDKGLQGILKNVVWSEYVDRGSAIRGQFNFHGARPLLASVPPH